MTFLTDGGVTIDTAVRDRRQQPAHREHRDAGRRARQRRGLDDGHLRRAGGRRARDVLAGAAVNLARGAQQLRRDGGRYQVGAGRGPRRSRAGASRPTSCSPTPARPRRRRSASPSCAPTARQSRRRYTVNPTSRFNVHVNVDVPELANETFGALIEVDQRRRHRRGTGALLERARCGLGGGHERAGDEAAVAPTERQDGAAPKATGYGKRSCSPWLPDLALDRRSLSGARVELQRSQTSGNCLYPTKLVGQARSAVAARASARARRRSIVLRKQAGDRNARLRLNGYSFSNGGRRSSN